MHILNSASTYLASQQHEPHLATLHPDQVVSLSLMLIACHAPSPSICFSIFRMNDSSSSIVIDCRPQLIVSPTISISSPFAYSTIHFGRKHANHGFAFAATG
jgi:hypothetical protein